MAVEFKPVKIGNVKRHWSEEAMVCFDCPCGVTEIILGEESGEYTCDKCGRIYRIYSRFEVTDVEICQPAP